MNQNERRRWLLHALLEEMPQYQYPVFPYTAERQWRLLRSLMNVRPPMPAGEEFLKVQDAFLREMTAEKGVTDGDSLPACKGDGRLVLWQGDITTLKCDAIVNAANSQLLGCFSPCHGCIDNMIHTMSGVQLRLACNELMQAQEEEEPAGRAKITPGFNLPAKYVLHTVGPIVGEEVTAEDERLEAEEIYPIFAKTARDEGFEDIAGLFENVITVEKKHQRVFTELYEQMKSGTLYKKKEPVLWKCPSCGYEGTQKEAWEKCPLCQAEQGVIKPILPADACL